MIFGDRKGLLAVFDHTSGILEAVDRLRDEGMDDITVMSPVVRCEIEQKLARPEAPVRRYALGGGIAGLLSGIGLTVGTSLHYPLMTSAKPIISVPPFIVISFELTILFAAISTVIGLTVHGLLPELRAWTPFDRRFTGEHFGLFVGCRGKEKETAEKVLKECGAQEVDDHG